jgi:DNA modification methylase
MSKKDQNIQQPVLFDAEEMGRITPGDIWEEKNQPVTCLGMEFPNDDARREYFREELRKKLPELRQIEGFPIGKDEDIIQLSDPPYYTACPNPWLNDFIAEWEKEKVQLEAEGKRKKNFEVKEPYASDVSEGKSNPVYTAHTYHTKVPHPAIMRYILHYTQPGDVILDGFAGTGMTGVAAQACGNPDIDTKDKINNEWRALYGYTPKWGLRHAICSDLSPYASSIAYVYNTPINARAFEREARRVISKIEEECKWLYTTRNPSGVAGLINYTVWSDVMSCKQCGCEFNYWDVVMDIEGKKLNDNYICPHCGKIHNKKDPADRVFVTVYDDALNKEIYVAKSVPVMIVYTCNGKRLQKRPDKEDIDLIDKISSTKYKCFVATQKLPDGEKTREPLRTHGITNVHLYNTKRNSLALSIVLKHFEESCYNNILKFLFTGMVNRSSKMNRVHFNNFFFGGGGWNAGHMKGTLYVPNISVETSILEQLDDKLNSLLRAIPYLSNYNSNSISVSSANHIQIADNSIDYIFVDPPFGANIMYSELNYIVEGWLKVITNNDTEAIENRVQGKTSSYYQLMMTRCFAEYYRILKPGKWITIEFSNTKASVWNAIQRSLSLAGFVIANVAGLDKKQGGMRSITTSTAVRQDLAITCYKPSDEIIDKITKQHGCKENAWDFIEYHLGKLTSHIERGNKTTTVIERSPKILYDRLISYYVQHGLPVPMDAHDFQVGLRERFVERDGMFFTALQAAEYEEKRKHTDGFVPMGIIVSDEANGIEWLKNQLRESPKTYQQIQPEWMQAINGLRKGDILPELKTLLEENFIEMSDGKWRLPNIQDDKDVNALRTKALLREFKIYVDVAQKPKAKIKEARVEALRAGFKQCYVDKDFQTIVTVGDKIPQNLLTEDEVLLQFYDIAQSKL